MLREFVHMKFDINFIDSWTVIFCQQILKVSPPFCHFGVPVLFFLKGTKGVFCKTTFMITFRPCYTQVRERMKMG